MVGVLVMAGVSVAVAAPVGVGPPNSGVGLASAAGRAGVPTGVASGGKLGAY